MIWALTISEFAESRRFLSSLIVRALRRLRVLKSLIFMVHQGAVASGRVCFYDSGADLSNGMGNHRPVILYGKSSPIFILFFNILKKWEFSGIRFLLIDKSGSHVSPTFL